MEAAGGVDDADAGFAGLGGGESVEERGGWIAALAGLDDLDAGTVAVGTVPFLVGVIPASFITLFVRENIAGTVPVTIVIGIAMILIGTTKARIEATELSLRTQQLERERAEKLAAEAQLASLSSRVQPHFLFNTLNSISGLIREQPAQAETMIEHFASS